MWPQGVTTGITACKLKVLRNLWIVFFLKIRPFQIIQMTSFLGTWGVLHMALFNWSSETIGCKESIKNSYIPGNTKEFILVCL